MSSARWLWLVWPFLCVGCKDLGVSDMRFACDPGEGDGPCGPGCRCVPVQMRPYAGVCECGQAPVPEPVVPDSAVAEAKDVEECVPACAGRECGDDGCGGTCGVCSGDETCKDGRCVVVERCPGGWCVVPAGPFRMGCNTAIDGQCDSDELPQHEVILSAFEIARHEVTVGDYASCLACGPPGTGPFCNSEANGKWDHPVNCVNWDQAASYCEFIGRRLCTEAEWEKAARGGCEVLGACGVDERIYPWGNKAPADAALELGAPVGNFKDATCVGTYPELGPGIEGYDDGYAGTSPAESFWAGASPYGVMDMAGNVAEWVADPYDGAAYEQCKNGCSDPQGPAGGNTRVVRGGSFKSTAKAVRASARDQSYPWTGDATIGFRCCGSL